MDTKLARGFAREAFEKLPASGSISGGLRKAIDIMSASYSKALSSREISGMIDALETYLRADPTHLLVSKRYLPVLKKGLLHAISARTLKSKMQDEENPPFSRKSIEKWEARFVSTCLVLKSGKADIIEKVVPVSLTFHVAHRFIEREETGFDELLRQMPRVIYFSYFLAAALRRSEGLFPVVFPIGSGLLLGRTTGYSLRTDGTKFGLDAKFPLIPPGATRPPQVASPEWIDQGQTHISGCEFNTFISSREMRNDQAVIFEELVQLFSSHLDGVGQGLLIESPLEPLTYKHPQHFLEDVDLRALLQGYIKLCTSDLYEKTIFRPAAKHV
jgi:hypothetical protein